MCEQFEDGSSFLKADYGISCLDANRDAWVLYAVVMLIIYPIGIPMVYLFSLMRWKHKINPHTPVNGVEPDDPDYLDEVLKVRSQDPDLAPYVFLFGNYEPENWYFEVLELFRKVLLTGFIVWMGAGTASQILCAILITLGAVAVTQSLEPFLIDSDDHVAVLSHYQLLLTLLGALVLAAGIAEDDGYGSYVGTILVCTTVFSMLIMVAAMFEGSILKRWHKKKSAFPDHYLRPMSLDGVRVFLGGKPKGRTYVEQPPVPSDHANAYDLDQRGGQETAVDVRDHAHQHDVRSARQLRHHDAQD